MLDTAYARENEELVRVIDEMVAEERQLVDTIAEANLSRTDRHRAVRILILAGVSERLACKVIGISRSSYRYRPIPKDDQLIRAKLRELARIHPEYGYRKLGAALKGLGISVNHKRVYRLYREESLQISTRRLL